MRPCDDRTYLYIHFSALKWWNYEIDSKCISNVSPNRLDVCFATHCSRNEVLYFIKYFPSKKIVGFPNKILDESVIRRPVEKSTKIAKKKRKWSPDEKELNSKKVNKTLLSKIFDD